MPTTPRPETDDPRDVTAPPEASEWTDVGAVETGDTKARVFDEMTQTSEMRAFMEASNGTH